MGWFAILATLGMAVLETDAFSGISHPAIHCARLKPRSSLLMAKSSELDKTTLTTETRWRLRLLLNDVKTTQGRKLDGQLFVLEGNFIEEEGYEPPQGTFKPLQNSEVESGNDPIADQKGGMALELVKSYWKLSEDPDDPKDGLWVWGLFKEPLYPFMLLQIETKELLLPGENSDGKSGDSIPPLKLYAQITHIRNKEVGVELKPSNLNVRVLERIQLPGASVDLFEEEPVGKVSFQPF